MTKKDYELVAKVIRETGVSEHFKKIVAINLAEAFRNENPDFKGSKFFEVCGIGGIVCTDQLKNEAQN